MSIRSESLDGRCCFTFSIEVHSEATSRLTGAGAMTRIRSPNTYTMPFTLEACIQFRARREYLMLKDRSQP
jgi:hypothetical protein